MARRLRLPVRPGAAWARLWPQVRRPLTVVAGAAVVAAGGTLPTGTVASASTPPTSAPAWRAEPASYGVAEQTNVPVTMSDGTVLRADVYTPADPATGKPAPGPFPVLLTQTPYGKESLGADPYFVQRGYMEVVADVRGTGDSGGTWGLFDPVEARDGAQLVGWSAHLPHADGQVGLFGESYLGIDQFLTVSALGPNSPVKAMFPVITANDIYRDTAYQGGLFDSEFDSIYTGLTTAANEANPPVETLQAHDPSSAASLAPTESQHLAQPGYYTIPSAMSSVTGGEESFDGAYWQARNPVNVLQHTADLGIPAFLVGGWYDLFQRGEPLNFTGLQNAYDHRPVTAPLLPGQGLTGRYQLMMGPWYHLTAGQGVNLDQIQLEWFDTWLRHENTGMAQTKTPLHLYQLGANRWVDTSSWPAPGSSDQTLYLGNGGTLTPAPPTTAGGPDTVVFTGASSGCSRSTAQWSMGASTLATPGPQSQPCTDDDRLGQAGPGAVTYTTGPVTRPMVVNGPMDVTLFATSTRPDTEWVATVDDVAPDGTSTPLTSGALIGSDRALDPSKSWLAPNGRPLLPYHPYTRGAVKPVTPGAVTRYDIEVFPTFAELAPGHRLRLTLATSDTPHLMPDQPQFTNLVGGVYQVEHTPSAASFVELSLAPAAAFSAACTLCQ